MNFHSLVFNDQLHAFPSTSQRSSFPSSGRARQNPAFDHSSFETSAQVPTSSIDKWTDWSLPTIMQPYSSNSFESFPYDHNSMSTLPSFFSGPLWTPPLDSSYTNMPIDVQPKSTSSLVYLDRDTPGSSPSSFCDTPSLTPCHSDSETSLTLSPSYHDSELPGPDLTIESAPKDCRSCVHCGTSSTSAWRRVPGSNDPMCNACGLYIRQRNMMRPQMLIDADAETDPLVEDASYDGPECNHCHTRKTSAWRRSKEGLRLCNACGLYSILRGKERPLSLKKNTVKPRAKRNGKVCSTTDDST